MTKKMPTIGDVMMDGMAIEVVATRLVMAKRLTAAIISGGERSIFVLLYTL
jgi:hypothetical protein